MDNDAIASRTVNDLVAILKNDRGVHAETAVAALAFFIGEQVLRQALGRGGDGDAALRNVPARSALLHPGVDVLGPQVVDFFGELLRISGAPGGLPTDDLDIPEEHRPLADLPETCRALRTRTADYLPTDGEQRLKLLLLAEVHLFKMTSQVLPLDLAGRLFLEHLVAGAKTVPVP
jgi:hypothetical protein